MARQNSRHSYLPGFTSCLDNLISPGRGNGLIFVLNVCRRVELHTFFATSIGGESKGGVRFTTIDAPNVDVVISYTWADRAHSSPYRELSSPCVNHQSLSLVPQVRFRQAREHTLPRFMRATSNRQDC